mmetsp:Transcript_28673/g.58650  ORF Transcript_28673/g.58650 Transcript_28673/m.58650 type:complete len:206 (+) Transcript_28673:118-735(+)|eukprot:CAMPEP_0181324604 /NCGR_PEP_ID=MMETSP1101-20121128/20453_1 /TAXON_ID=46948 /ORGANISM="Rhodomonas abbreviata, Strain Caron Lab Isolate" /LENGTH=205 /DNA_ID=CAMNT_0023432801 /DNA_START=112 /DNA_END=729 /DNA_ORIENTATION=-
MFFTILCYASGYLVLIFLAICMACGLYYMAELAEEYSRLTKKILKYCIFTVLGIHALLLVFDGFPIVTTLFGIALHGLYYQFLKDFPFVNFSSPLFIAACVGLLINHWLWIAFFREELQFRVTQIMAFFVPCVWLVPFGFFVSVSLGDTVLPSGTHSGGLTGAPELAGGKSSAFKALGSWFSSKRDQAIATSGFSASRDYYSKDT